MEVTCVVPPGAVLGEGALWDVAEQALYWVDIKGRRVHRYDPRSDHDQQWPVPQDVGSLTVRAGGGLVLLYVTSASINLSTEERARQPWAGGVLALDPGVHGLTERRFAG